MEQAAVMGAVREVLGPPSLPLVDASGLYLGRNKRLDPVFTAMVRIPFSAPTPLEKLTEFFCEEINIDSKLRIHFIV